MLYMLWKQNLNLAIPKQPKTRKQEKKTQDKLTKNMEKTENLHDIYTVKDKCLSIYCCLNFLVCEIERDLKHVYVRFQDCSFLNFIYS